MQTTVEEKELSIENLPDSEQVREETQAQIEEKNLVKISEMRPEIVRVCSAVKKKYIYSFVKRIFDIFASAIAIILLSPIFLIVALKIKKESPGPALFKQKRVGKNGKIFTMLKFRSMYVDAEERLKDVLSQNKASNGLMFKAENDPRITPFGQKIRKTSIDELPQLFNIFVGDMSFVGPRPPLPREVVLYEIEWTKRLAVKGGLTCYWQLAARNEADFEFCYEQDMKYIKKRNWWIDIVLIFKTFGHVFTGKGE